MKETIKTTAIHSLETVRCRIENWRTAKQGRRAMPEELWQAAAELTEHYSINRIAKELRLNVFGPEISNIRCLRLPELI